MSNNIIEEELLLLKRVSGGDHRAFQQLFNKYWDRVFANALRFLKDREPAYDLAQEVFIRVWVSREKLADVRHFESWLYRIAKNLFLDHLRKQLIAVSLQDFVKTDLDLEFDELSPQKKLELNELQNMINNAIAYLPAQMQMAFKLSRFQGLTHEQIARKMNISKTTSQNYIARSLVAIRSRLLSHPGQFIALIFFAG